MIIYPDSDMVQGSSMIGKDSFEFTNDPDLNQAQIDSNYLSYFLFALAYAQIYERTPKALEKALHDTLGPFFEYLEESPVSNIENIPARILFAGSGSGRDLQQALLRGYEAVGIDLSSSMLDLAKKYIFQEIGREAPVAVLNILNAEDFGKGCFSGIFCESALSHIRKADLPKVLSDFSDLMVNDGIILLGFRESKSGLVYRTVDQVGIRYNTSYSEAEVKKLLEPLPIDILDIRRAPNPVEDRPNYLNVFGRKRPT